MLQLNLIIPVGKLAILQFMALDKLTDVISKKIQKTHKEIAIDCIPLPHPSGASTWHRREPVISLLDKALKR